jgi:hypothetical protein
VQDYLTGKKYTREVNKDQLLEITDEQHVFIDNDFDKLKAELKKLNENCRY